MNYFVNPYGKISPAANICRKFAANLPQPFYHANKGCGKLAANVIMQIRFAASLRQLFVANLQELHIYQCHVCRNIQIISFKLHSKILRKSIPVFIQTIIERILANSLDLRKYIHEFEF